MNAARKKNEEEEKEEIVIEIISELEDSNNLNKFILRSRLFILDSILRSLLEYTVKYRQNNSQELKWLYLRKNCESNEMESDSQI